MKTMIYVTERVHARLKHLAVDEKTSMAELIRQAIDEYLERHYGRKGKGGDKK